MMMIQQNCQYEKKKLFCLNYYFYCISIAFLQLREVKRIDLSFAVMYWYSHKTQAALTKPRARLECKKTKNKHKYKTKFA